MIFVPILTVLPEHSKSSKAPRSAHAAFESLLKGPEKGASSAK